MRGRAIPVRLPDNIQSPKVREMRVALPDGQEVLFGVFDANHRRWDDTNLTAATLPKDASILLPVDCEPGETARYYVYYGNEKAEMPLDFLNSRLGFTNGDMEGGQNNLPDGWYADGNTSTRKNSWSDENPHSGRRCLKTVIQNGEKPSWFAYRQSGIPIVGGGKYRFSGWVRGQNVKGQAGWFVHVGNEKKGNLLNRVMKGGDGDFDWKEIVFEFTAPEDSDRAMVGTVLHGTGTAWFDDVRFERLDDDSSVTISIGELDFIPYKIFEADPAWPTVKKNDYLCRSTFRIVNRNATALENVPVLLTLRGWQAHGLSGRPVDVYAQTGSGMGAEKHSCQVVDDGPPQYGACRYSVRLDVPPQTIKFFNVYYKFDDNRLSETVSVDSVPAETEQPNKDQPGKDPSDQVRFARESDTAHPELQVGKDRFDDLPNLLKNGNFEDPVDTKEGASNRFPPNWYRNDPNPPEGVRYLLETDPKNLRFGKACARLDVAEGVPTSWRGWTQRINVRPNASYLIRGWIRSENIGSATIHVHFHNEKGAFCKKDAMTSLGAGISGTRDWTAMSEVLTTPPDAVRMTIHLTTNSSGMLWHDNISVFEGLAAKQIDRESFLSSEAETPLVWQVPAVMKVFPQTISTQIPDSPSLSQIHGFGVEAARNEKEPLQLAIRSKTAKKLKLKVTPLSFGRITKQQEESKGESEYFFLNDFEIHTVGYVAVDYPSNYYNTKVPKWHRKTPTAAPGCDGWKGFWPDPLLPTDTIALKPNQTESVWITWSIPKNAPAGIYLGKLELFDGDQAVYENMIRFKVRDFTLPDENHVSAIYDVRFGPGANYWSKPKSEYYREIADFMAANRLAPDTIDIEPKIEWKDDRPVFDWTEYDKACQWYFNERKFRFSYFPMNLFYLFGWGHPPKKLNGENPYPGDWPFKDTDFTKLRPEYKAKYQACLREFWNHVKEKGWADRFILYISDEPNYWTENIMEQMIALCDMIHEVDPEIPIYSSTWRYMEAWKDAIDVWGIAHYGLVPVDTMREIKQYGSKIWFTTDGMLCLDTPYNAIERLLPHYCFKYGADAYEFWGIAWLTRNPYRSGSHDYIHQSSTPGEYYWVRYPNGDGYLIYPPEPIGSKKIVSSIRFEQAREGVEDFEYLYLLKNRIEQAKTENRDVAAAEKVLEAASDLVDCPAPIGRYSSEILPDPNRLYEWRRRIADAIEILGKKK